MYTAQYDEYMESWEILDPDGDHICYLLSGIGKDALLSHLNRS